MKLTTFSFFFAIIAISQVANAQVIVSSSTPTVPTANGAPATPPKTGPKPYKEIITDKTKTQLGLFIVHKVEDKYFFEIPSTLLNKEILCITRYSKTPVGGATYGGEIANEVVLKFEKAPDHKIFVRTVLNIIQSPDSTQPMFRAVANSNVDPIAQAFDVKAYKKDSVSKTENAVIDVTDFFKGDNLVVSINARSKKNLGLNNIATDRSYIDGIKSFPINTEVRTVKTFISAPNTGGFTLSPSPFPTITLPAANEAGAVTVELNTSFIELPKNPIAKRMFDSRVGYFASNVTTFEEGSQRVEKETFASRWRLEPKDEDKEKYKKGELVEPKKQIVYYIDPATPKKWRAALIQGINDWQFAFEKAGFKNAIVGKEWPENDSTMSLEDARFSVLRYFASDIENAYGPSEVDPRSGEILESHIGWYHNVMKLLQNWYMIQCAAVDPKARKMKFDDELMSQLIRFVSSHEVGHTLGLRHNMGSSNRTPVEKLRDKKWVEANGHTASIMDYARFNYVAQPEDNISQAGLFPRIGEYDLWAIEWGYRWNDFDAEGEKKWSNNIIVEKVKNPRLWFGGEGRGNDPRAQTEDLSDNNMKAGEYGIKNLKRLMTNILEWTKEEGDRYENLNEIYSQLVNQYSRYASHVSKNIGGFYETFKSVEESGSVYEITPKTTQKDALAWMQKQVFETPTWLMDKKVWDKITIPGTDPIMSVQQRLLSNIINSDKLVRLAYSSNRDVNAYGLDEMFTDLQKGIWSELATKKDIDIYRRSLQKTYVDKLIEIYNSINGNTPSFSISFGNVVLPDIKKTDVGSVVLGQLNTIQSLAKSSAVGYADKMSKLHLLDIAQRIKIALEGK
ncbi:MAG: zinc-dependent metalloprotease [Ferruginibacter sp.]|nr:zinc-dependent metalloprotease [Ferruginibacter sp.]